MIQTHRFDLLLRVLIADHGHGLKSASLLEIELPPACSTDEDAKLCEFVARAAETCIKRGHGLLLPAVSPGIECAWIASRDAEELAELQGEPYNGARARYVRLCFDVPACHKDFA